MPLVRTHVVLPEELVQEIDALVGRRGRSRYVTQALEERLSRERRSAAARAFVGSIKEGEVPEWDTAESAAKWVHDLRRTKSARQKRLDEKGWIPGGDS